MVILIALLIYLTLGYILFKFPWILHSPLPSLPNRSAYKIWTAAHRGGSGEIAENTLEAFLNSSSSDLLELDVVLSKDKVVVVSHDNNLLRLTGQHGLISQVSFKDLPAYLPTLPSHFLDSPFNCEKTYSYTSLEQVFQNCPKNYICVDIKEGSIECIHEVKRLIKDHKRENMTVRSK